MRITKTQKDAVISLLREKFDERQKIANKQFEKEHEAEIAVEVLEYKQLMEVLADAVNTINQTLEQFDELANKFKFLNLKQYGIPSITYSWTNDNRYRYFISSNHVNDPETIIRHPQIKGPDYCKVGRQLELDTLSKDFNVEEFLKKYLEN